MLDFIIVIVNYNTYSDCEKAIQSILLHTFTNNYRICVLDNNSKDSTKINNLSHIDNKINCFKVKKNYGYGRGNNEAILLMEKKYKFKYVFVMNPDVEIIEDNTFSNLINTLENKNSKNLVGGQPLIWMPNYGENPRYQNNIRKIDNLFDVFLSTFCCARIFFKKKWSKFLYIDDRPYNHEIEYTIPAGCFFFIKYSVFKEIGLFDSDTFLYNEELILGKKLKDNNKKFLFMPQYTIKHWHGGSTGIRKYCIKWSNYKYEIESKNILLKKYYNCNYFQLAIFYCFEILDFIVRKIVFLTKRGDYD